MTEQEQQAFIDKIGPLCVKYAKKYGFKVASPAIAQACLESTYGTSSKALHHNYFGLKYRANRLTCNNGTFFEGGSEQNPDGSYRPVYTQWFNFDTMEAGVEGYYQFINISNYNKVKDAGDPLTYLQEIKNAKYATSINYVQNVYNVITKWNLTKFDAGSQSKESTESVPVPASKSSLVDFTKLSPNNSGKRTHAIDRITPHCIVGQWNVETIGNYFSNPKVQASCNYGIAKDGKVALVVDESMRSWCSSSNENDQRAVTIECSSEKTTPFAFNDEVYNKLIDLCADICKRNGKNKLLWLKTKEATFAYTPKSNEMVLTVHRWFKQKACPGDWLMARMDDLATKVTAKLNGGIAPEPVKPVSEFPYIVQVTASALNIRKGPGTNYPIVGQIRDRGKYTIMEVQNGFGKLKSGAGYISMKYAQKI